MDAASDNTAKIKMRLLRESIERPKQVDASYSVISVLGFKAKPAPKREIPNPVSVSADERDTPKLGSEGDLKNASFGAPHKDEESHDPLDDYSIISNNLIRGPFRRKANPPASTFNRGNIPSLGTNFFPTQN